MRKFVIEIQNKYQDVELLNEMKIEKLSGCYDEGILSWMVSYIFWFGLWLIFPNTNFQSTSMKKVFSKLKVPAFKFNKQSRLGLLKMTCVGQIGFFALPGLF